MPSNYHADVRDRDINHAAGAYLTECEECDRLFEACELDDGICPRCVRNEQRILEEEEKERENETNKS